MATTGYLLIESRDPWESADVRRFHDLAISLARSQPVTLFLVQNGVLAAREGAADTGVDALKGAGVEVLADEFSLRERGIARERLRTGVRAGSLDIALDRLAEGNKTLFV